MRMAETNVPTAMYKLCMPTVVRLATTALKLDSPNGRACATLAASESGNISPAFTTASNINSSVWKIHKRKGSFVHERQATDENIVYLEEGRGKCIWEWVRLVVQVGVMKIMLFCYIWYRVVANVKIVWTIHEDFLIAWKARTSVVLETPSLVWCNNHTIWLK